MDAPIVPKSTVWRTWTKTDVKPCSFCFEVKPLGEFNIQDQGFLGRTALCTVCIAIQFRKYSRDPTNRMRVILNKYGEAGIAVEKRKLSGDGCDICGSLLELCIDHDHKTGKVRGLLCSDCNLVLGILKDDQDRLESMIKYLRL